MVCLYISYNILAEGTLIDFQRRIEELEKKLANAGNGGSGIDMSELEKLLSDYLKKSDMDDWLKRLEHAEKKAKKANDKAKKSLKKIIKWKPIWKEMHKDIEDLKALMNQKVDQSLFDQEIDSIKDLINQLASSGKDIKMPLIPMGP